MREDKRIIFPSDRDIIEERDKDNLRDLIHDEVTKESLTNGVTRFYHVDRIIQAPFRNGKLNGVVRIFDLDSNLLQLVQYVNDVRYGLYTKYHHNGNISCVGTYKDGKCWGVWKYFDLDGNVEKVNKYS